MDADDPSGVLEVTLTNQRVLLRRARTGVRQALAAQFRAARRAR